MPKNTNDAVATQIQMILTTDNDVPTGEVRKFPAAFHAQGQSIYEGLTGAQGDIHLTESEREDASEEFKTARKQGEAWVRSVYGRIQGLPPTVVKQPIFTAYGFANGNLGALDTARVLSLLTGFPTASAAQTTADTKLPADWLTPIAALKEQIETLMPEVSTGARGTSVQTRNAMRLAANDWLSRVFGWLIYALPKRDADPLMRDYGFKARKLPEAKPKTTPPA